MADPEEVDMMERTDGTPPGRKPGPYEVRAHRDRYGGNGWGVYDTRNARFTGVWFAGHIRHAAETVAATMNQAHR